MADRQWTAEQASAIGLRGGTIVCAAAAGAGKTAVLTERVISRVADPSDPVDIRQLLVVTFTRAAAAEMRARIASALRERAAQSPALGRQAQFLHQADISTLHSFCERTLRRHFPAAGLDPSFRILPATEAEILREQALDGILDRAYAEGDDGHAGPLLRRYGGRQGYRDLRRQILRLHEFARKQPDPQVWLEAAAADLEADLVVLAQGALRQILRTLLSRVHEAERFTRLPGGPAVYQEALASDREALSQLVAIPDGQWDAVVQGLRSLAFRRLPSRGDADGRLVERAQNIREGYKSAVRRLTDGVYGRDLEEHQAEQEETQAHLRALATLARDLDSAYTLAKSRGGSLDFDDLEHRLLQVLSASGPDADAIRKRYREILVDESQDLNPIQDELLRHLTGTPGGERTSSLFSVGDVRQSIYGFRLAAPDRFVQLAEAVSAEEDGHFLLLPDNFRTRRRIIDGINHLFGHLFAARGSDLPEAHAGPLRYGADYPELPEEASEPVVTVHLVASHDAGDADPEQEAEPDAEPEADTEPEALELEARVVAARIAIWLGAETPVWDRDTRTYRPARPGDIAVLLRAPGGDAWAFAEAITATGIPCWSADLTNRQATPEARTVLAWLRTLDNPRQDVPLVATLRGPFGGFTDDELARIRLHAPKVPFWQALRGAALRGAPDIRRKATHWMATLRAWRSAVRRHPVATVLLSALSETGTADRVAALPGGAARRRTLDWLVARCREADCLTPGDLGAIIAYLESPDGDPGVGAAAAAAGDRVRVLSVHASKGLEFPLVIVARLGRRLSSPDARADMLVHRRLGLGARAADPTRRLRWPTLRYTAIAAQLEADDRAEELRILYVAMTRARERLWLVGHSRDLRKDAMDWSNQARAGGVPDLGLARRPLDWLVPTAALRPEVASALDALAGGAPVEGEASDPLFAVWVDTAPPDVLVAPAEEATDEGAPEPEGEDPVLCRLRVEAAWRYPFQEATTRYAKIGAGELARSLAPVGLEEVSADLDRPPDLARPRRVGGASPVTPAEVGTATHLVLGRIDLGGPVDQCDVQAFIQHLASARFLEPTVARHVDAAAIARILHTPLGLRLRQHPEQVRREVPFLMRLPADAVYAEPDPGQDWVLVQGAVDCLLVAPDHLLLCDYKTDRIAGPEDEERLLPRYSQQIRLYGQAMASAWGRPATELYLVFLNPGIIRPIEVEGVR